MYKSFNRELDATATTAFVPYTDSITPTIAGKRHSLASNLGCARHAIAVLAPADHLAVVDVDVMLSSTVKRNPGSHVCSGIPNGTLGTQPRVVTFVNVYSVARCPRKPFRLGGERPLPTQSSATCEMNRAPQLDVIRAV